MNRLAAFALCWLALGLERGFASFAQVELGSLVIAPSLIAPVLVFFCIHASPGMALWTCFLAGVAIDLTWFPATEGGRPATVLGLYALGFTGAGWFVLKSRGVVIKKNPVTLIVLSIAFVMLSQTWITFVMGFRALHDDVLWSTGTEWASRMASAGATGITGLAWWLILTPTSGLFGFHHTTSRFTSGRMS